MVKIYTRGPKKNAIFLRKRAGKLDRIAIGKFKLNNLFKNKLKTYLFNLLLYKN